MTDPLVIKALLWPDVEFYDKQIEVIQHFWKTPEVVVPAGNQLGKDYLAGFCALARILAKRDDGSEKQTRGITTSVKDDHLRVLWGEIGRFVQTAKYPLTADKGGPLIVNHRDIRKIIIVNGKKEVCPITYLRGMVSEAGEGMSGHHAEDNFCIMDECSGINPFVYDAAITWAKSILMIGNCMPSERNHFFQRAVREGDVVAKDHVPKPDFVVGR